jgi:sterol desaturase/sphingolipid hydroxylase (fatty acid hydroxylase superfamily)
MEEFAKALEPYSDMFLTSLKWLVISLVIFVPLAHFIPSKKSQPLFRKDMEADALYWFIGPFIYNPILHRFYFLFLSYPAIQAMNNFGTSHLATLPLWQQAALILLISDFFQYWLHRLFHRDPLWKYHAIHHSSTEVDWLTSARFHPVNIILYSTWVNALVLTMGFSFDAFLLLIPFNSIYSPLVHANVPWTYGPLKYVFASPVFHRWHHTHLHEGGNRNFAPTFSFLDVMFGTFYMPKDKQPEVFGIAGNPVPDDFVGQLLYPFKTK